MLIMTSHIMEALTNRQNTEDKEHAVYLYSLFSAKHFQFLMIWL